MDYLVENWGSFVGVLGLLASIGGLVYALLARRAAKSAEQAAKEAQNSISQTLCLVSTQRAIALVARLSALHRESRWDAASELYQELRMALNDIDGTMPYYLRHFRPLINRGIGQLELIQSHVYNAVENNLVPPDFTDSLKSIQTTLEALMSGMMPTGEEESE